VRSGLVYCLAAMALGQAAIALGIAPTLVRTPLVHGLAALAALGTVFTAQLLASTTAQREESEETARVLLDLAHSLSRATTRQEVADRLVSSVPAIVGTDRAAVLLWDDERQGLTNVALTGYAPEEAERLHGLVVRPADWPLLTEVVADPTPRRYAADDAMNELARELMARSQTAEALYVPVV